MSHVTVVAEIGINHNGSVDTAIEMVGQARAAGADMVKFQKRVPSISVPRSEWDALRETPWGQMRYIEYKERLELTTADYAEIDAVCRSVGIPWLLSVWDIPSAKFALGFDLPFLKIPSAKLTDWDLLAYVRESGVPAILSCGMSTLEEIDLAVARLKPGYLLACTSAYPCPPEQLNLRTIPVLQQRYPDVYIGWSGHEVGLAPTLAAVALGAEMVERHVTLDRTSWGTDQAASVEFPGLKRMVKDIRLIEKALGDGKKRVMPAEESSLRHLRGVTA